MILSHILTAWIATTNHKRGLGWGDGGKILRKFLVEKNEKEQQLLVFIKASFQGYWPIFIRRIAKKT